MHIKIFLTKYGDPGLFNGLPEFLGAIPCMLQAAIQNGWLDPKRAVLESLLGIKRAGADMIITYFAEDVLEWL